MEYRQTIREAVKGHYHITPEVEGQLNHPLMRRINSFTTK